MVRVSPAVLPVRIVCLSSCWGTCGSAAPDGPHRAGIAAGRTAPLLRFRRALVVAGPPLLRSCDRSRGRPVPGADLPRAGSRPPGSRDLARVRPGHHRRAGTARRIRSAQHRAPHPARGADVPAADRPPEAGGARPGPRRPPAPWPRWEGEASSSGTTCRRCGSTSCSRPVAGRATVGWLGAVALPGPGLDRRAAARGHLPRGRRGPPGAAGGDAHRPRADRAGPRRRTPGSPASRPRRQVPSRRWRSWTTTACGTGCGG